MASNSDTWEAIQRKVKSWDVEHSDFPPTHRTKFLEVVAKETIRTWDEFQGLLNDRFEGEEWAFRGQSNSSWRLDTSLERAVLRHRTGGLDGGTFESYITNHPNEFEGDLLLGFQRRAHHYIADLPPQKDVLDWFALMQHYGVPTRLLDWTYSPYVALYFALQDSELGAECAVWAVDVEWLNRTASEELGIEISAEPQRMRAFNDHLNSTLLNRSNPSLVIQAAPVKMNERMAAQQGVFLCDLGYSDTFDITLLRMIVSSVPSPAIQSPVVWKVALSTVERVRFLRELSRMNIHGASLFPGLQGLAQALRLQLQSRIDEMYEQVGWGITSGTSRSAPTPGS